MKTVFYSYVVLEHNDADREAVQEKLSNFLKNGTLRDALSAAGLDLDSSGTTGEYEYETEDALEVIHAALRKPLTGDDFEVAT